MTDTEEVLTPGLNIKPIIDAEQVQSLIKRLYGLNCVSLVKLPGYDDINYKVVVPSGSANLEFVCKILNSLDSRKLNVVDAQCALLIHLRLNGIQCPNPIKNRTGEFYSVETLESGQHVVRLLEYLPGTIITHVAPSPSLLYEAGKFLGKLNCAAQTFDHKGYNNHKSIWQLNEVAYISKFLYAIKDIKKRHLIEEVIDSFKKRVIPFKRDLERGLLHGDINEHNIVVQKIDEKWHITGILDFGDAHIDCYLFDLAVAITYMIIFYKDVDAAGYVIAGYSTIRPPTAKEFELLKVCVAGRLCQSLVLGAYSILQDPENEYILTSAPSAWKLLQELWPIEEETLLHRWKTIANDYIDK